jgi:titin
MLSVKQILRSSYKKNRRREVKTVRRQPLMLERLEDRWLLDGTVKSYDVGPWSTLQVANLDGQPGQEIFTTNGSRITVLNDRAGTVRSYDIGPWSTLQLADLGGQSGKVIYTTFGNRITVLNLRASNPVMNFNIGPWSTLQAAVLDAQSGQVLFTTNGSRITVLNVNNASTRTYDIGPWSTLQVANLDGQPGQEIFTTNGSRIIVLNARTGTVRSYDVGPWSTLQVANLDGQPGQEIFTTNGSRITVLNYRTRTVRSYDIGPWSTLQLADLGGQSGKVIYTTFLLAPNRITVLNLRANNPVMNFNISPWSTLQAAVLDGQSGQVLFTTNGSRITVLNVSNGSTRTYDLGSWNRLQLANLDDQPGLEILAINGSNVINSALTADVQMGGSGYAVNDTISIAGGRFSQQAVLRVTSESGGAVTGVSVQTPGNYAEPPTNPVGQATTSGRGSGATFSIRWTTTASSGSPIITVLNARAGTVRSYNVGPWSTLQVANLDGQPGQEIFATNGSRISVLNYRTGTVRSYDVGPWSTLQVANLDGQPGQEIFTTNGSRITVLNYRTGTVRSYDVGPWSILQLADLGGQSGKVIYTTFGNRITVLNLRASNPVMNFNIGPWSTLQAADLGGQSGQALFTTNGGRITVLNVSNGSTETFDVGPWNTLQVADLAGRPGHQIFTTYGSRITVLTVFPPAATHFSVTAQAQAAAGSPFTVTVRALDNRNNTDVFYSGTVHFTSTDRAAVLPGDYTFTAADNGQHTFAVTLWRGGNQTLTVRDTGTGTITGSTTVTVTPVYVVSNTSNSGPGSLRQAILTGNFNPGLDTITFNISGPGIKTIDLASPLPTITNPVVIDGTTQPGYAGQPPIELNGAGAGAGADGLLITAGNSTVKGLVINRFSANGIELQTNGGNIIQGNYIGTDVIGTRALGNGEHGVAIYNGAQANLVGTDGNGVADAATRNLISGNGGDGVAIYGQMTATNSNVVAGNYIGTDVTGTKALGNQLRGVEIRGKAQANRVGTRGGGVADAAERNLISANSQFGVWIWEGAANNVVAGNYIGTDVTGTKALGNGTGVVISAGAHMNRIGSSGRVAVAAAERNIISGNVEAGILIQDSGSDQNVMAGNFIGTNASGTTALGNGGHAGIIIWLGAKANRIGSRGDAASAPAERNLISGNLHFGIHISGSGTDSNIVAGNYIGTDVTGSKPLGNTWEAVNLAAGTRYNRIGTDGSGDAAANRNLLSANLGGVKIEDVGTQFNTVAGNYIGTDVTGTKALGNLGWGIWMLHGATRNTIGTDGTGSVPASKRNIISANGYYGFYIQDAGTNNNTIAGNYIGTDVTGTAPLGNELDGVLLLGASDNLIGGTTPDAANQIAFNGNDGVLVDTGTGNAIRGNAIYSNNNLGIELINNGNNSQPFPVLSSAASDGSTTTIEGTLAGTANATLILEFFANPVCNPSGFGEGKQFLGSLVVTTDADGNASFTATFNVAVNLGAFISATATDSANNTSQFAQCIQAGIAVENVVINDGSAQRSMVTSITVTFNTVVTLDAGAIEVVNEGGNVEGVIVTTSVVNGKTVAMLTFTGDDVIGGSLADGHYNLITHAEKVHDNLGQTLDKDRTDTFFRLFGDSDGKGFVDNLDLFRFRSTYGKRRGEPGYLWYFDYYGAGIVDDNALEQFYLRYGGGGG